MSAFFHIILIIGNILLSFLISVYAPGLISDIDTMSARILGGSFFLLLLQLHILLFVVRVNKEDTTERLLALHQDYQVYQDQLENTRHEFMDIKKRVESKEFGQNKEIINEMRLLQTLLGQVVEKSGKSYASSGKNREAHSIEMEHGGEREAEEILNIMHYALEDNRIDLYLQPIVSLPVRKVVYYEAYSRVRDDKGEVIFPSQYIKLAEDSGLVSTLDNLLLFRCIQVIRRLGTRRPNLRFFCNISSVSLNDKEFFPQFIDFMLDNHELSDRLVFEFTQQDVQNHSNNIWASLATLGKRGFRFSVDNVQTLNHDLSDLAARYFKYVKLTPELLLDDNIDIDRNDIKEAYSRYDIEVIVEKIEDDAKLVEILDCDIDRGQGYLFGEPVISSDITKKL